MRRLALTATLIVMFAALALPPAAAQDGNPPLPPELMFSLPFTEPPGPNTWLYEQHYGNTTQAYNYGDVWYMFGQGMHFGLDLEAPCGTPVHAIADGRVVVVDEPSFGAGPHNLVMEHTGTGYTSIYGHMQERSPLNRDDLVDRGDLIGVSGDPDGTCGSRPHLHLEIRSDSYQIAHNPLLFIDADWHMLTSIGPYNNNFQQALEFPYRWMRLEDQPEIELGANPLNNYLYPWPPKLEARAPENQPRFRNLDPLPDGAQVSIRPVALDAWNVGAWWYPDDTDAVYIVDTVPTGDTVVMRQPLDGSERTYAQDVPPALSSPDGAYRITYNTDGTVQLAPTGDGSPLTVSLGGVYPAVSPGNKRLLWEQVFGEIVPGSSNPSVAIWASNLDGSIPQRIYSWAGSYSMWLDDDRVLVIRRVEYTRDRYLYVIDLSSGVPSEPQALGTFQGLNGLQVSPGGEWIAYYLPFQEDPNTSGVYVQRTQPGSQPVKLPFFGPYRWRDDDSLFVLSYGLDQPAHALGVIDLPEDGAPVGDVRWLTDPEEQPIRVANGEWSVSPDGSRIVFLNPDDYGLYVIEVGT